MKKNLFLLLLFISLDCAFGQDIKKPESKKLYVKDTSITNPNPDFIKVRGGWWHSNSFLEQVPVLTGFYDGISLGAGLALKAFEPKSICITVGAESYNNLQILDNIPVMALQDEITAFYKDSLNDCISLQHAFWISANKLAKSDSNNISKLIEMYRKQDCFDKKK